MKNYYLSISLILISYLISSIGFCQFEEDSIEIEKTFKSILQDPDSYEDKLKELKKAYSNKKDSVKDILDFAHGKFLFKTGQFDKAMEIIDQRIEHPFNTN